MFIRVTVQIRTFVNWKFIMILIKHNMQFASTLRIIYFIFVLRTSLLYFTWYSNIISLI